MAVNRFVRHSYAVHDMKVHWRQGTSACPPARMFHLEKYLNIPCYEYAQCHEYSGDKECNILVKQSER